MAENDVPHGLFLWEREMEENWAPERDAVAAAPDHHRVLFEDDDLRVLLVELQPGDEEPLHHHRWSSVFVFDKTSRIRVSDAEGSAIEVALPPAPAVKLYAPQQMHKVANIDDVPLRGIRVEFKRGQLVVENNRLLMPDEARAGGEEGKV